MTASETIERAALQSLHRTADEALRAQLGLEWRDIGAGSLSLAARLPASAIVVNRALGLDPAGAREAVAAYGAAGVERFFLNGTDPGLAGIGPARGWRKFRRNLAGPMPVPRSTHAIRELGPVDGPAFARIVCAAFDLGPAAEPWLARLPGAPGWRVFGAMDPDGEIAGVGALFRLGDAGWTDWGATRPSHRGQGVQAALLAHRVRVARDMGLATLHTCTGEAVPGDPQHSYANILRAGFEKAELRANFAPALASGAANA